MDPSTYSRDSEELDDAQNRSKIFSTASMQNHSLAEIAEVNPHYSSSSLNADTFSLREPLKKQENLFSVKQSFGPASLQSHVSKPLSLKNNQSYLDTTLKFGSLSDKSKFSKFDKKFCGTIVKAKPDSLPRD